MPKATKRILIAEDEKPLAKALELKLNNSGFEARTVFDGQEAIDALKREKFDLLLLDLMMPRADGFAVLEALKKDKIKTPVIVLSNLSQAEDAKKAKAMGAMEFFIKSDTPIASIVANIKNLFKL